MSFGISERLGPNHKNMTQFRTAAASISSILPYRAGAPALRDITTS